MQGKPSIQLKFLTKLKNISIDLVNPSIVISTTSIYKFGLELGWRIGN